jgi:hypothetical protein
VDARIEADHLRKWVEAAGMFLQSTHHVIKGLDIRGFFANHVGVTDEGTLLRAFPQ